jgi:hypothetical protein
MRNRLNAAVSASRVSPLSMPGELEPEAIVFLKHVIDCERRMVSGTARNSAARPQLRWRISNVAPKRLNFSTTSPMRTSAARAGAGSSMAHCAFIWGIMAAGRLIGACCSAPPTNSSCPPAILISRYPHCFLAAIVNRAAVVEKRLMSE